VKAIFGKEPVVWIGILGSLLLTILSAISGQGVIVEGNIGLTISNLITVLAPIIAAFFARNFVTPVQ
jgi:hypothetical protein